MILNSLRFGFIGGGNMASAMVCGLLHCGVMPQSIAIVGRNPHATEALLKKASAINPLPLQITSVPNSQLLKCDVLVFAVKPQQFQDMVQQIKPFIKQQLLISVAAGIRLTHLQHWFNNYHRIVRAMPNTPVVVNQGTTGLIATPDLTQYDRDIATAFAQAIGNIIWVKDDNELDAVTAISGSGPAYVFYFIEAIQNAALALGLSSEQGKYLAITTFTGAAALAQSTKETPAQLCQQVTSPGGATYAALNVLNQCQVHEIFKRAILASAARSKEMGNLFAQNNIQSH